MQEILYRGRDIDQKKWRYGSYVAMAEPDGYVLHYICELDGQQWIVFPDTVSQYIGIKDIHQKKVFRGDIVKVKQIIYEDCSREDIEEIREYTGEVVWHQFGYCIATKTENGTRYHFLWTWNIEEEEDDTMEIIGNRWDNPKMAVVQ